MTRSKYGILISASAALALALGACSSGGGGDSGGGGGAVPTTPVTPAALGFQNNFFPVQGSAAGVPRNVAFNETGDLLVADGGSIHVVSQTTGEVRSLDVSGTTTNVISLTCTNGTIFAGTSDGFIYTVSEAPLTVTQHVDLNPDAAVTAMALASAGFAGGVANGRIVATTAEDDDGPSQLISFLPLVANSQALITVAAAGAWSDFAFSANGSLAYILDMAAGQVLSDDAVNPRVQVTAPASFTTPVGIALDAPNDQLLVADAANGTLSVVDLAATPPVAPVVVGRFDLMAPAGNTVASNGIVHDGVRSAMFATVGSNVVRSAVLPGFSLGALPALATGAKSGFGAITLDVEGDVIGVANGDPGKNVVYRIDRDTNASSHIAEDIANGEVLLSIAYDPDQREIYVGTGTGKIFQIDVNATTTLLRDLTQDDAMAGGISGLALAPESIPTAALRRRIYAATDNGLFLAVEKSGASSTLVGAIDGDVLASPVFGADGMLYVANYSDGAVETVDTGTGVRTVLEAGLGQPDGLTLDPAGNQLYVANSQNNELVRVPVGGGGMTIIGVRDFAAGPEPSGIVSDGLGAILMATGETGLQVEAYVIP